mgnify:CR=1 FL=1
MTTTTTPRRGRPRSAEVVLLDLHPPLVEPAILRDRPPGPFFGAVTRA